MMRRLLLPEIHEAVAKTGYRLKACRSLDTLAQCGCPIVIVALAKNRNVVGVISAASELGLTDEYRNGFVYGFDSNREEDYSRTSAEAIVGNQDGRNARTLLEAAP